MKVDDLPVSKDVKYDVNEFNELNEFIEFNELIELIALIELNELNELYEFYEFTHDHLIFEFFTLVAIKIFNFINTLHIS